MVEREDFFIYTILAIMGFSIIIPLISAPYSGFYVRLNNIEVYYDDFFSGVNNTVYINTSFTLKEIDLYINNGKKIDHTIEKKNNTYKLSEIDVSTYLDGIFTLKCYIDDNFNNNYEIISSIRIDNNPPIIEIHESPNNTIKYNNSSIIKFEALIRDFSLKNSTLIIKREGIHYKTLYFNNSNLLSYQNEFILGNYTYTFIAKDILSLETILNGSFEVENNLNNTVKKDYDILHINYPRYSDNLGYNIILYIEYANNTDNFEYKIFNFDSSLLIISGDLMNATSEFVYLDIFNEELIIEIYNKEQFIYSLDIEVESSENINNKKSGFDYNLLFLLVNVISLTFTMSVFVYGLYREKRINKLKRQ